MAKRALIFGITGQDGSYLADLLLSKGYEVYGVKRRSSSINTARIDHIFDRVHLRYGDVTDALSVQKAIEWACPSEIYNLAAQSHVQVSFETPVYTAEVDLLGPLHILEVLRGAYHRPRFYQASTSEMFGSSPPPQSETTPFHPCSPYGAAKLSAYWLTRNYREAYDIHASNGILFNHESPRRGETFVTRKIVRAIARGELLRIGNLEAKRDWGHARDYVEAMWLMLQQDEPDDYVISTGRTHTVRDFINYVFELMGTKIEWIDIKEPNMGQPQYVAVNEQSKIVVESDPRHFRPLEVESLCGENTKAREKLGWEPTTSFEALVKEMLHAELEG